MKSFVVRDRIRQWQTRTIDGVTFVRGFLQHTLPKSFLKVRYYGWMASNSRTTRDRVKWLVWLFLGWTFWLGSGVAPQPDRYVSKSPPCRHCGEVLQLIAITDASGRVLVSRPLPQRPFANYPTDYLDSG